MQASHLAELLLTQARLRPDAVALIQADRTTTYGALLRSARRVASALRAAGVVRGTRVACLDKDSERIYELLFGCALRGAVLVGLNWRLTAREVRYMLADSEARVVLAGAEFWSTLDTACADLPELRTRIVLRGQVAGATCYDEWLAPHAEDAHAADSHAGGAHAQDADDDASARSYSERAFDPEEVAVQMYTSGTTGHPKGVELAQRSFFAVPAALRRHGDPWIGWSERDVTVLNIPSFHIGGLWWSVLALQHGARIVILESFSAWQLLEAIERWRVTKVCLVPAMIQTCLDEPSCLRTDFSSLTHLVYGGSPISTALLRRARDVFGCGFAQIYGLTETGNTAVCLRPDDHASTRTELLRAAGRPYPGVRVEIVDGAGRVLPPRAIGEIRIHSPANMLGYWKQPEATARTLRDGWIHTGDAGYVDEHGYVYVCDRVKDMIISAGENIYPAEIESVLAAHPALLEVAVIGVPHERWGEAVKALAVLRSGMRLSERELLAFARGKLADFKLPRSVEFVAGLPRTPSGKLKKAELRAPYWAGRERQVN
jgi:long-chain acyl-CoA synthetase